MQALFVYFVVFFILLFAVSACGPAVKTPPKEVPYLVWPGGKEIRRIRFVNSVSRPEDVGIVPGAFKRFWRYFIGESDKAMVAPFALSVDSRGNLYVVDTFWRSVQVFDSANSTFRIIPSDDKMFDFPVGVAVSAGDEKLYVADSKAGCVRVVAMQEETEETCLGQGVLKRPTGLTIHERKNELLVTDTKLATIFRYDLDSGRLLGRFGSEGVGPGQFNHPTNITVSADGNILVTDALNARIQIFSATGEFLKTFGSAGDSPGHFARPRGVATDSDGNIYVVDALFDNIQIFDRQGRLLMAFGESGEEYGQFWLPAGIHIDKHDRIYVADLYNKRVQIFQYLKQVETVR